MGTSISHRSPNTLPWRTVWSGYTNGSFSSDKISNEVWRAITNSSDYKIGEVLKSDFIYSMSRIASKTNNLSEAIGLATKYIITNKCNSILAEIAKRALIKSFIRGGKGETFKEQVFAETANYYISRDLSGFLNKSYRNKTIKDMIAFKNELIQITQRKAKNEDSTINTHDDWDNYVSRLIFSLRGDYK